MGSVRVTGLAGHPSSTTGLFLRSKTFAYELWKHSRRLHRERLRLFADYPWRLVTG